MAGTSVMPSPAATNPNLPVHSLILTEARGVNPALAQAAARAVARPGGGAFQVA